MRLLGRFFVVIVCQYLFSIHFEQRTNQGGNMNEMERKTLTEDFILLEKGREYNRRISLYDTVNRNERFYRGDQWHGVEKGDLPTPGAIAEQLLQSPPDILAFTHGHSDHCSEALLLPYRKQNLRPILGPESLPERKMRVGEVTVTAAETRHLGKTEPGLVHMSYVIRGSKTVWFMGDASPLDVKKLHKRIMEIEEFSIGDIVFLESGDKISADMRIVEAHNFMVDESILTGESLQVEKDEEVLVELAALLSLEIVPQRIESIDISNSGASAITAGIITLENARFLKRAYKSFSIESDHPDDPGSIYRAIKRRVQRYLDGDPAFSPLPDLILADGGIAQVLAAKKALAELGVSIPVFGMVKDEYHKTRHLTDGESEISIAFNPKIFQFIYGIQEEVHRFSLKRMDQKRRKSVKTSSLCAISGIGEKKAGILMRHFKSLRAIQSASTEAIARVSGISARDAENIYHYFHKKEEEIKL